MIESTPSRASYVLLAFLIAGLGLAAVITFGTQTSKILSTVGNPVPAGAGVNAPPDAPAPGETTAPVADSQAAIAAAEVAGLLIVRTGTLDLEVADLGSAVASADAAVTRSGGYVSASTRAAKADDSTAQSTYRIPSAGWDRTLGAIRARASVVKTEETKTQEVTGQVVDLSARISNLRSTEAALQGIMAKATKIADVLDVQTQLTTTRGEIERLVAEKAGLADRASFGSLTVTFRLPVPPQPTVTPAPMKVWDPGTDVANATGKLVRIGQRATSAGIWVAIVGLPIVIVGAIVLLVGWQVVRLGRWLLARRSDANGSSLAG